MEKGQGQGNMCIEQDQVNAVGTLQGIKVPRANQCGVARAGERLLGLGGTPRFADHHCWTCQALWL